MAAIESYAGLKAHLKQLQDSSKLDEAALKRAFAEAKANSVRVSASQAKDLFDAYGARVFAPDATGARSFMTAVMPALSDPSAGGLKVGRATLSMVAGADKTLQKNEIDVALEVMTDYFVSTGMTKENARARAKTTLMGELGLTAGGTTIHKIDQGQIVDLAKGFGDPLAVHTKNYQNFISDRAFRESRGAISKHLAGLSPRDPVLEAAVDRATSFDDLTKVLRDAGKLEDAVRYAATEAKPPFRVAFAALAKKDADGMAEGLRKLDNVQVAVVDANNDSKLDEDDIVAIQLGDTAVIKAVDSALTDRLRIAKAMQRACRDMTTPTGESKFDFHGFPPKFNGEFFEGNGSSGAFRLKSGKSASAAIRNIIQEPQHYKFECATAIVLSWHIAQYRYFQEKYGDEADARFDAKFNGMTIGARQSGGQIDVMTTRFDPKTDVAMAGEWRYFKAWDVDDAGKWRGWQGENVIYMGKAERTENGHMEGDDLYFGHPFGITTRDHIIQSLNEQRFNVRIDSRSGITRIERSLASRSRQIENQIRNARGEERARLEARKTDLERRLAQITDLKSRLQQSATKRQETKDYIDNNRSRLRDAENAMVDAGIRHGQHSQAYRDAEKKYRDLVKPIDDGDRTIDSMDRTTLRVANQRLTEIEVELEAAKANPSRAGDVTLLNAEYAALKAMRPTEASMDGKGQRLRPTR